MIETTTSNSTTVTPLRDRSGNPNLLLIATPKTTNQRDKNPKTPLVEYRKALFCQKTPTLDHAAMGPIRTHVVRLVHEPESLPLLDHRSKILRSEYKLLSTTPR